jgi:hypothetical protein
MPQRLADPQPCPLGGLLALGALATAGEARSGQVLGSQRVCPAVQDLVEAGPVGP